MKNDAAKLYTTDGKIVDIFPENGESFTLKEMQKLVGGFVETVKLAPDVLLCINEDGKFLKECEYNYLATQIAHCFEAIMPNDYIEGNAVACMDYQFK